METAVDAHGVSSAAHSVALLSQSDAASAVCMSGISPDALPDSIVHQFNDHVPVFGGAQFVRLVGLKEASMNQRIGTVSCYGRALGRFGVVLCGETTAVALKSENLVAYVPDLADTCAKCNASINLHSFPECSCLGAASTSRTSSCSSEQPL